MILSRVVGFFALLSSAVCLEYTAIVCEDETRTVNCPAQMHINVLAANYGRTDSTTCTSSPIYTTDCRADALSIVRGTCQDKHTCDLEATNSIFGDPCEGVYKYLSVTYECKIIEHEAEICEDNIEDITCPDPFLISIEEAFYGRDDNFTCGDVAVPTGGCSASKALVRTRRHCNGESVCTLEATNDVYGDPCVGTYKYLRVKYTCLLPEYDVTICKGSMETLRCHRGYHIHLKWANYGRTNGEVCPSPDIYSTQCRAPFSRPYFSKFCDHQLSCRLESFDRVLGDPCIGTDKYIHVKYTCEPEEQLGEVICEDTTAQINCYEGKVIVINSAYYGRTDATTCLVGEADTTSCINPGAEEYVRDQCGGKASCSVSANNELFGDPCFGTSKYLFVKYNCV